MFTLLETDKKKFTFDCGYQLLLLVSTVKFISFHPNHVYMLLINVNVSVDTVDLMLSDITAFTVYVSANS